MDEHTEEVGCRMFWDDCDHYYINFVMQSVIWMLFCTKSQALGSLLGAHR